MRPDLPDFDDERWTAFALGELEDETLRARFEEEVERSEAARAHVEDIRGTAALLREELSKEPAVGLTDEQRKRVSSKLATPATRWLWWGGGAVAATLAAVLLLKVSAVVRPTASAIPDGGPVAEARRPRVSQREVSPPATTTTPAASPAPPAGRAPVNETTDSLEEAVPPPQAPPPLQADEYREAPVEVLRRLSPEQSKELRSLGYIGGTAPVAGVGPGREGGFGGGAYIPSKGDVARFVDVDRPFHTEAYDRIEDNPFLDVSQNPLSTFSIDVDTASYANVRRYLESGSLPPKDAVRIEEMINYFDYDYPDPPADRPFSVNVEVANAPWAPAHRLVRIGLKGRPMDRERRPPLNLVFLLDVSGSMEPENKLPLLKDAMRLLVDNLRENDHVAIAVYAGASGLVLPSTSGDDKIRILDALDRLQAGGSTNGGAGIALAYDTAAAHFVRGGINRVVLATDGDFNVGVTNQGDLTRLIEERAKSGVFLSVLGFGMGNLKDSTLEKLADRGNGNYAYVDSLAEARKVLVQEMGSTLVTIAKDVKIQVELNPAEVESYRLIGYENRMLRAEDFNDDKKDAGEIGAGHTVTALYELVPPGEGTKESRRVDPLKYQRPSATSAGADSGELLTVKLRYKDPDGDASRLLEVPVRDDRRVGYAETSRDDRFAAAVAAFGMILRDSPYKGTATLDSVLDLARTAIDDGRDPHGYRAQFVDLVRRAKALHRNQP